MCDASCLTSSVVVQVMLVALCAEFVHMMLVALLCTVRTCDCIICCAEFVYVTLVSVMCFVFTCGACSQFVHVMLVALCPSLCMQCWLPDMLYFAYGAGCLMC